MWQYGPGFSVLSMDKSTWRETTNTGVGRCCWLPFLLHHAHPKLPKKYDYLSACSRIFTVCSRQDQTGVKCLTKVNNVYLQKRPRMYVCLSFPLSSQTEVCFVCPRSHKTLSLTVLQKDRTVKTASAVVQSLSQGLSQQDGMDFFSFWALRKCHIHTHTSLSLPRSLHTCPNQLSRDESEGSVLCECVSLRTRRAGWTLTQQERQQWQTCTTTQHTHASLFFSVTEALHCYQGFIEHSVFILPQSTYSPFYTEKAKVPRGEMRILVHYSRNSWNTLTDDLKFSV